MRLIDANALIHRVVVERDAVEIKTGCDIGYHNGLNMAVSMAINAPTVDAVEVVWCKDCKHWHEETGWCNHHSHFVGSKGEACHPWESSEWKMLNADDFCSYGERSADGKGT